MREEQSVKLLHIRPYSYEVGSVYKYGSMFGQVSAMTEVVVPAKATPEQVRRAVKPRLPCDLALTGGDWWGAWKGLKALGIPYILVEHDVHTLRLDALSRAEEREMLESASAVLFTSEDHRTYCDLLYDLPPSAVVHLRPMASDLDFEPLPKLEGRHLVYAGGLTPANAATGPYGYRSYHSIFRAFIEQGWTVHVYPCYLSHHREEYTAIGCVMHDEVPETELPRELSQYTAGLQAYANDGCQVDAFMYTQTCRPNKTWTYLSAGIPTIGYQGGRCSHIYDGKWGVHLDSLHDLTSIELPRITEKMRRAEVMDVDKGVFSGLLTTALKNPRIQTEREKSRKVSRVTPAQSGITVFRG